MAARSAVAPVQSNLAASVWAIGCTVMMLPVTLGLFFVLFPPVAWRGATDAWFTLSFSGGTALLLENGLSGPSGQLGWSVAPVQYVRHLLPLIAVPEALITVALHLVGAVFVAVVPSAIVFRRVRALATKRITAEHVRGSQAHWGKAGVTHLAAAYADSSRQSGAGVRLSPNVVLPQRVETEGLLLVGRPGSGKTVILEGLVAQALARGDRVFTLDIKGGLARRLRRYRPRVLSLTGAARRSGPSVATFRRPTMRTSLLRASSLKAATRSGARARGSS